MMRAFHLAVTGAVAAGAVFAINNAIKYETAETETVRTTVTDKEIQVRSSDGDATTTYLVFTQDEVFQNSDNLFRGKVNSSDVQGRLKVGCDYDLKVHGFRSQMMSVYRNILDAKHVPTPACPSAPNPR